MAQQPNVTTIIDLSTKDYWTLHEAAAYFQVKPLYMYRLIAEAAVGHTRFGSKRMFPRAAIMAAMKSNECASVIELTGPTRRRAKATKTPQETGA